MTDHYPASSHNIMASARRAVAVTVSDTIDLGDVSVGLIVTTAGNYPLILADDSAAVTLNLAAGVIHPVRVKRVMSTGAASTAGIVAVYGD